MTNEERLIICSKCHHRGFDPRIGDVCKLTASVPDFIGQCDNFKQDFSLPEIIDENQSKEDFRKNRAIRKVKNTLFIIGAIIFVLGANNLMDTRKFTEEIIVIVLGLIFIIFGIMVNRQPYYVMIVSLITYIIINSLLIYLNPLSMYKDIALKVIIVTVIAYGIRLSKEAQSELYKHNDDLIDQF